MHKIEPKSVQLKELLSKAFVFGKKPNLIRPVTKRKYFNNKSFQYKVDVKEREITNKAELQDDCFEADCTFNDEG